VVATDASFSGERGIGRSRRFKVEAHSKVRSITGRSVSGTSSIFAVFVATRSVGLRLPRWIVLSGSTLVIVAATCLFTPFRSPEDVLAERTWGAGRTSTSTLTAIALGHPWWHRHKPRGLVQTAQGGFEHEVRIARTNIVGFPEVVTLPHRSLGYDAVIGGLTALRSLGEPDLVYDWWTIVRAQQTSLVLALLAPAIAVVAAARRRSGPWMAAGYAAAFVALVAVWPFESHWLIDGIIDSALSAPAALAGVPFSAAIAVSWDELRRPPWWCAALCGLGLGMLTMIRGELAFAFLACLGVAALWKVLDGRRWRERIRAVCPALVAVAGLLAVPAVYGFVNVGIHGHFVPFRLQAGQNLVEPVGEFPNPWGIEYSDEWMMNELRSQGIDYVSFEADRFLTGRYFSMLAQEPGLFVRNFVARLGRLPGDLGLGFLGPFTVLLLLGAAIVAGRGWPAYRPALVPLVMAIGLVLFHAWFGSPPRVLAPVRFLVSSALCGGFATLLVAILNWYGRENFLAEQASAE